MSSSEEVTTPYNPDVSVTPYGVDLYFSCLERATNRSSFREKKNQKQE
jgi:hypothetical protein